MQCDGFYEQQARLDGVICDHTKEDKMDFLKKCYKEGVRNMEMECSYFGSFTQKIGVRAAMVCVAFLNRFAGDQVLSPIEDLIDF